MKKFISILLLVSFLSHSAMAECDFSTGIIPNGTGAYTYSKECHIKVGQLIEDNKTKDQQITLLNKAIELKDLALTKSDERVKLWMDTSTQLEERLNKVDQLRSSNNFLYFGLGLLTVVATGFVIAKWK
jgi:hypothetical protein